MGEVVLGERVRKALGLERGRWNGTNWLRGLREREREVLGIIGREGPKEQNERVRSGVQQMQKTKDLSQAPER
jgi:hypothetical protein